MQRSWAEMNTLQSLIAARTSDARYDPELWRFDYDHYRYLKNLTAEELDTRLIAIDRNLLFLLDDLRDAPPERTTFISSWWWLKKRVQTLTEYEMRGLAASAKTPELPPTTKPPFEPKHANECSFAVRYGELAWLRAMLEEGRVRISPAASFADEALASAQQDDELEKPHYSPGHLVKMTTEDGRAMPIIGDVRHVRPAMANYYVLCAANEFDRRLFPLFANKEGAPSDACLIIWDIDAFAQRLEKAGAAMLDGWFFHHNFVQYFDPRRLEPKQRVDAGMCKDFSFAHQREYRFLWMPVQGSEAKAHFELVLGPLGDIAGLFTPDGIHLGGRARA